LILSLLNPEETFLKDEKINDRYNNKGIIGHEKINFKINSESDQKEVILRQDSFRDIHTISLFQREKKCITDIINGKCNCDVIKNNVPDFTKSNNNFGKLNFSQTNLIKTNLRKIQNEENKVRRKF